MGGGGGGLYRPPEHFQIWMEALKRNFHNLSCLRQIDLEYENGKQLQVTIIKITESKENNSIHRLDLSGSTGPGEAAGPLPPRWLHTALVELRKLQQRSPLLSNLAGKRGRYLGKREPLL